jgi:hypothetical protein
MKPILKHICAASVMLAATSGAAQALTLGAPIFTTAPSDVFILNQFEFNAPSDTYTLTLNSTIATAVGAPDLVGKTIHFETTIRGIGLSTDAALSIDGVDLNAFGFTDNQVFAYLPVATTVYDAATNTNTDTFSGIFETFGPVTYDIFTGGSGVLLQYILSAPLPQITQYEYCEIANPSVCTYSFQAGLTEISGVPVADSGLDFSGPEGTIHNATLTFYTVNGRTTPSPVPLPAGGLLFISALAALGLGSRLKKKTISEAC